jgi:hypothetical protein
VKCWLKLGEITERKRFVETGLARKMLLISQKLKFDEED